jgi:hypothetical protein
VFRPGRLGANPPRIDWPVVRINAALDDFDAMALREFAGCSNILTGAGGALMQVRCNYGTPIMAMLFGAELFIMEDALDTLPGSRPVAGGADAIRALLDRGEPALDHPYSGKVFEMARRFAAILAGRPKLGRCVQLYHPDVQGPMDICELVWGSGVFLDLYENPKLVHDFLGLVTRTYIRFMRRWFAVAPPATPGLTPQWGMLHRGGIMLRDDSAMNLSPEMFEEFIRPYDQRLLDEFGGGAIHSCGKVDHYVHILPQMRGVYGFHMSQPQYNDLEKVFASTIDRGIVLLGLAASAADAALAAHRPLRGRVHV